jgi:hypothetical protein
VTGYTAGANERGHDDLFDEFLTKPVQPSDIEEVMLRGMATKGDGGEGRA